MREIKFRAWDKQFKRIISWDNLAFFNPATFEQMCRNHYERFKLMQFTGLKDKNGKEIYEGDIIKTTSGNSYDKTLKGIFEVIYFCDGFKMKWILQDEIMYKNLGEFPNGNTEIIGNIYENPELLIK